MKNSLGSILFLLISSLLYAEDFTYDIRVDNPNPYVKEGVILTLDINQTNHDIVLLFNFDIKKSKNYSFTRLDSIENDTHHNAHIKYIYLLYPLKKGALDIEFNLLKKVTNDDSITYSYSGDRDNVKALVTEDTKIKLPPLALDVKAIPKDTLLVGEFKLTHTIKKHNLKAYEPIPFNITLEGTGYPPLVDTILPKGGDFTRFTEKPIVHSRAGIDGTKNRVVYPIAISSKDSFTLPKIGLKGFNPKTKKSYELTIPKQRFEIKKVAITNLIDKQDTPIATKQDWSWLYKLLSYILIFIAGYLTAITLKWQKKDTQKESTTLEVKIKKCKDKKELLQLLIASRDKKFASTIEELEGELYRKK